METTRHGAKSPDVFCRRKVLLGLRTDCSIINDRAASDHILAVVDKNGRIYEISAVVQVARSHLGDLANPASHWILVAVGASCGVVDRTEPAIIMTSGFTIDDFAIAIPDRCKRAAYFP